MNFRGPKDATLYRYYDQFGCLLYVGITRVGPRRGSGHSRDASWWLDVARAEFMHAPASSVRLAERLAIWTECPRYNVADRVSTERRQAMLALLETPLARYSPDSAAEILGLTAGEVMAAINFGFLDARPGSFTTAEALRAFIGESDTPQYGGLPRFVNGLLAKRASA